MTAVQQLMSRASSKGFNLLDVEAMLGKENKHGVIDLWSELAPLKKSLIHFNIHNIFLYWPQNLIYKLQILKNNELYREIELENKHE